MNSETKIVNDLKRRLSEAEDRLRAVEKYATDGTPRGERERDQALAREMMRVAVWKDALVAVEQVLSNTGRQVRREMEAVNE